MEKELLIDVTAKPLIKPREEVISTIEPARRIATTISRIAGLLDNLVVKWQSPQSTNQESDVSIIVVPSIEHSIHDLFEKLYSGTTLYHTFLVSLSDIDNDISSLEEIVDQAPVAAWKPAGSSIFRPGFHIEQDAFTYSRPTRQGKISIHTHQTIAKQHQRVVDALLYVSALKFQDFRRTDLDEDGKTIQKSPFEGWDKWSFAPDEEGEDWKGDNYTPPWAEEN